MLIVVLIEQELNERELDRSGVNDLSRYGEVIVIDLSELIRGVVMKKTVSESSGIVIKTPRTGGELEQILRSLPKCLCIDYLGQGRWQRCIRKEIRCRGLKRVRYFSSLIPCPETEKKGISSWIVLGRNRLRYLITRLACRILPSRYWPLAVPEIAIITGDKCRRYIELVAPYRIYSHTMDYEQCLFGGEKKNCNRLRRSYGVFIDQDLLDNHDRNYSGRALSVGKDYYTSIDRYLGRMEERYRMEFVVLGHPKVKEQGDERYGGRQVIYGEAREMIKGSRVVIGHYSACMNMALILGKELIITSEGLLAGTWGFSCCQEWKSAVGEKGNEGDVVLLEEQTEKREEYIKKYIRSERDTDVSLWKTLVNEYRLIGAREE